MSVVRGATQERYSTKFNLVPDLNGDLSGSGFTLATLGSKRTVRNTSRLCEFPLFCESLFFLGFSSITMVVVSGGRLPPVPPFRAVRGTARFLVVLDRVVHNQQVRAFAGDRPSDAGRGHASVASLETDGSPCTPRA